MQQILNDARKLASSLRDHDNFAGSLMVQAQTTYKQVESMQEYSECVAELNEIAKDRPRSKLIQSIQQENRYVQHLQKENQDLRDTLEEHQKAMELIMSKYRKQVSDLVTINKHSQSMNCTDNPEKMSNQIDRMQEMVAIMQRAVQLDEEESEQQTSLITSLSIENRGLKQLLNIAGCPYKSVTAERDTQTEASRPFEEQNHLLSS